MIRTYVRTCDICDTVRIHTVRVRERERERMGNSFSSSDKDHVKGPGLYSVQSASGALPEFVDFYDRPEKKWKVRPGSSRNIDVRTHTHTHTAGSNTQVLQIKE